MLAPQPKALLLKSSNSRKAWSASSSTSSLEDSSYSLKISSKTL